MARFLPQRRPPGTPAPRAFRLLAVRRLAPRAILPALGLVLALSCVAQSLSSPQQQVPTYLGGRMGTASGELEPKNSPDELKRERLLNAERQKALVSDADRLLKLARLFDDEMLATNPDSLTPAQVRLLNEIEKLARSIKSKMSNPVRLSPAFKDASPFP